MKKETQQKLKFFAQENNWGGANPLDLERFYEFIIEAYKNSDTEISRDNFFEVINHFYKINEDNLDKWVTKFEDGIGLLKVYNKKGRNC